MSTIELRQIIKRFGSFTAVRDVDLSVAAGEVVCLLGPSGCGKTTTLRIIAGLERASSGDVVIARKRMNNLKPERRDIAMVFQFYALYPALSVRENIMFPLYRERLGAAAIDDRQSRADVGDELELATSGRRVRVRAVESLQRRGVIFLSTPDAYYEETPERVGETVGNDKLANRGVADQVKCAAKETWGNVKDAANKGREQQARDTRENISRNVEDTKKRVNDKIDAIKEQHRMNEASNRTA